MRKFSALLTLLFCFLSNFQLFCQDLNQNISGNIINQLNEQAIEGANITILNTNPTLGTSSQKDGTFIIEKVPVGRYTILIQHVAFQQKQVFDVTVKSAKETHLNIYLLPQSQLIKPVNIIGNIEPIYILNGHTFTPDEVNRYAATYNDPARLTISLAGVSTVNDQSNHISVHGNSPNANAWYLNGLPIKNPNHLSNAGTFSDQPSTSGGGVNILSSQVLSSSNFYNGNYPLHFSNVFGGVFDMHYRNGNKNNNNYAFQAGVTGLEASAEGPFSKKQNSSFLTNFRYSTVGLLTQAGVDFGDEKINYTDFSFNLNFKLDSFTSDLNIFGLYGTSINEHEFVDDDQTIESDKDFQEIYYDDINYALGATCSKKYTKSKLELGMLMSTHIADRNSNITIDKMNSIRKEEYSEDFTTLSFTANYKYFINNHSSIFIGNALELSTNFLSFVSLDSGSIGTGHIAGGENDMIYNSSFAGLNINPNKTLYIKLGLKSNQQFANHKAGRTPLSLDYLVKQSSDEIILFQPLIVFGMNTANNQKFELSWQMNSQRQDATALYAISLGVPQNLNLHSTKNNAYKLNYINKLTDNLNLLSQVYYQHYYDVPIVDNPNRVYSTLNNHAQEINETLKNNGTGDTYGMDVSLQKEFSNNYYLLSNLSLFKSTFEDANGKTRSTTYDGRYVFNLTTGYEKQRKKNKNSFIGANVRLLNQGGYRHTPIDITASQLANKTVFLESQTNSLQNPDYFRVDAGVRFIKNKKKATRTWSIDIQNITNNKNVAYKYYDIYFQKIKTKYHLEIIPVINYKIEF